MKARLPSAPLTQEDLQIWMWVVYRFCARNRVLQCPINGFEPGVDHRDADLMYVAAWIRSELDRYVPRRTYAWSYARDFYFNRFLALGESPGAYV